MAINNEIRQLKATETRAAKGTDGAKILSGHAVVFNSPYDLGQFTEICAPGMFTRTLRDNPQVLLLRDHKSELLLGNTTAGSLTLKQDDKGLAFTVTLPNTAIAEDTYTNVEAGNLSGCSFGFACRKDDWANVDGKIVRTLLDVDLFEVSITSFAANPATSVDIRSCPPSLRSLLDVDVKVEAEDFRRYCRMQLALRSR